MNNGGEHEPDRQRLKFIIAYQGQEFFGSQRQPGKRTIQGELERAIAKLSGQPVSVSLAGRTDAGVHALGQVGSCIDPRPDLEEERLLRALEKMLPNDVSVMRLQRVSAEFDPRRDAKWRHYRYRIWIGTRQPHLRGQAMQIRGPINVMRMLHGAVRFEGQHDFSSVSGMGRGVPWSSDRAVGRGTVRLVRRALVRSHTDRELHGQIIEIDIVGDSFLLGQVRGMVGALLEVGRGKVQPDRIDELLAIADRRMGPKAAPSHGLTLVAVGYEDWDQTLEPIGARTLKSR